MTLGPGTKIGPHEILGPLGSGGMGEVFRARDTRLGREVAIKALPEAFSRDPERLARFEREARFLASLSHPNIAAIYGLEEAEGQRFLVLEFVEGETLAQRLNRGPLPVPEALKICGQIAAGVEAAHESGMVHRDLKPGNVMLTPAGGVKVLDFGLAKGPEAEAGPDLSASPTITYAPTGPGVILGTAAYMSPEQARGKRLDKRTDIWSFGCVLYECLTGRKAFQGETVSDVMVRILEREPDWNALPPRTPPRVRQLLGRCFQKDPRERLRDLGDARLELQDVLAGADAALTPRASTSPRQARLAWVLVGALSLALAAMSAWLLPRDRTPDAGVFRLSVPVPGTGIFTEEPGSFALSPDGRTLAFVLGDSSGVTLLWMRKLADPECHPLSGTAGATFPFWSPDSRHVGFFAQGKLCRIPAGGGPVQFLCDAKSGRGGAWGSQGVIVFAPEAEGPLYKVSAQGGVPTIATQLDSSRREFSHRFPAFLPDGRHFLYGTMPPAQGDLSNTCLGSLDQPRGTPVVLASNTARFLAPGYLVFNRDRTLMVQKFDGGKVEGDPVLLSDRIQPFGSIAMSPVTSSSNAGMLAYVPADMRPTDLIWLNRDGNRVGRVEHHPSLLIDPNVSPGGDRVVAVDLAASHSRIWLFDLARGTSGLLSATPGDASISRWSPDGRSIVCLEQTPEKNTIVALDLGGGPERILIPAQPGIYREPVAWAPDGRSLLTVTMVAGHQRDLFYRPLADTIDTPWVATEAMEDGGAFSPDGKWVAYTSDALGRREVFIDSYPEPHGPHRVSSSGSGVSGSGPVVWWRKDGGEIYFPGLDGSTLYASEVQTSPELKTGPPRLLFRFPADGRGICPAPDGSRFLLLEPVGQPRAGFMVTQNWEMELKGEK